MLIFSIDDFAMCGAAAMAVPPSETVQTPMTKAIEKPTCISIVACDEIYRDESTNKLVIAGTFNQVTVSQLPAKLERMAVFCTLTNGRGRCELALTIEHESTGQEIARLSGPATFGDPLAISDLDVRFRGLQFPAEGKYWITILADEEPLQQRPLFVRVAPQGGERG